MDGNPRERVLEEKSFTSGQVSQICRVAAFGLVAVGLVAGAPLIAVCGALGVLFDYLQYLFGYRLTVRALQIEDYTLGTGCWRWHGRLACFYLKQMAVAAGALLLPLSQ